MPAATRSLRAEAWWLAVGAAGTLLALLLGPRLTTGPSVPRWSGMALLAAIGGVTTAAAGPLVLPLAQRLGRRRRHLRPLTQGAAVGLLAAVVAGGAAALFPDVLAPIELNVGRGLPRVLLDRLVWALPVAAAAGAVLGLGGWAVVTQREALRAFGRLVRGAGSGTALAWSAAIANVLAATVTSVAISPGAVGAGDVPARAAAIVDAGAWWATGWALWAVASVGLLTVLVLLTERAAPAWRTTALAVATVAIAADLVAIALLAAGVPAAAPAAAAGDTGLFLALERTALVLSGPVANTLYGVVGLALIRAAGRRLHPLVRLLGAGSFLAVIAVGIALVALPAALGPVVAASIGLFVLFGAGFGWQLALSRRREPALEGQVRRAIRALVPLHPVPVSGRMRSLAEIDLSVSAADLTTMLPVGIAPHVVDGRAHVTVIGGIATRARPAFLPGWLGLADTPMVVLRVPVGDGDSVTFLRGWADGTFTASAIHWLTELQLARIDLGINAVGDEWHARGSAGSVDIELQVDPDAPGLVAPAHYARAVVERGGQRAVVPVTARDASAAVPARVVRLRIPYIDRLDAQVEGAALIGEASYRFGRARWS